MIGKTAGLARASRDLLASWERDDLSLNPAAWREALGALRVAVERSLDVFTTGEALQMLSNVGVDTTCGACVEIAFTGATLASHTCLAGKRAGAPRVVVSR